MSLLSQLEDYTALQYAHQSSKDTFFEDLTKAIQTLQDYKFEFDVLGMSPAERSLGQGSNLTKEDYRVIESTGINEIIAKRLGLDEVVTTVSRGVGMNACVIPPFLDDNNVVMTSSGTARETARSVGSMKARIAELNRKYVVGVDIKNARITGDAKKEPLQMFIGLELLHHKEATAEIVAAIVCHEIGHYMTYLLYLGKTLMLSVALENVLHAFNDQIPDKQRVEIIDVALEQADLDPKHHEAVRKFKSGEVVVTYIAEQARMSPINITGSVYYDQRSYEALSDQFATRLGGGPALIKGMAFFERYIRLSRRQYYINLLWRLLVMGLPIAMLLIFQVLIAALVGLVFSLVFSKPFDIYDPMSARVQRIRRDIINRLKDRNLSKAESQMYSENLRLINEHIEYIGKDGSFIEKIHTMVNSSWRSGKRNEKAMQELEQITNNEIYARVNELRGM